MQRPHPMDMASRMKTPSEAPSTQIADMRLPGWSVRRKIIAGFVGVIALMALGFGYTLFKIAQVEKVANTAIEHHQPAAQLFQRLSEEVNLATALLSGYLLTPDEDIKQEYAILELDLDEHLTEARMVITTAGDKAVVQEIDAAEQALVRFQSYAEHLFRLRDARNANFPGLALAEETMLPPAMAFLNILNLLLADEVDTNTAEGRQAYELLQELRYTWVQMVSYFRLYLGSGKEDLLENFRNFLARSEMLLQRVQQIDIEIGFGEIDDLSNTLQRYAAAIPPVVQIMRSDQWRSDTHLMRTEVKPLVEALRGNFEHLADSRVAAARHSGAQLTAALQDIRLSTALILFASVLFGTLLALRISGSIIPPIQRLVLAARQITRGDLNAEVFVDSRDEIGLLSRSFNRMVDTLREAALKEQSYRDSLTDLNQNLENRVRQRTTELETSQTKISAILDSVGEGIIVLDECGFIATINPAAEAIFGYAPEQAIGLNGLLLFSGEELTAIAELEHYDDQRDSLFRSSDGQQPHECQGQRYDGSAFPMEFVVTPLQLGAYQHRVCIVRDISTRKETEAQLADAQQQLVDAAHKSGMADMATGVLHNIGNILNSVSLAAEEVLRIASNSKVRGLLKANEMLAAHRDDLGRFLSQDSKGRKLPDYYLKLGGILGKEVNEIQAETRSLIEKTTMMKEVISTQQAYAHVGFHAEKLDINALIADALKIHKASLHKWGVKLHQELADIPPCVGQKSKLLQVITNLIKNAREAMSENDIYNKAKELHIETGQFSTDSVYLRVSDNGCGIDAEQLAKIFNHGFTTKADGHGFGLHTSANAMTEMKGTLKVDSDGAQQGATFTLTLPCQHAV